MSKTGWKKIGVIGVDSGLCWIGDPCYIMGEDASHRFEGKWKDFVDALSNDGAHKQWDYKGGRPGLGVTAATGGDGTYSVYALIQNGAVCQVLIDFMGDFEDA